MTLIFKAEIVKNGVSLCKLDVNIKNRTAVAGSVGFFNLNRNSLKEKVLLYIKFCCENQSGKSKGMQEKVLSWIYGVGRKICQSGSLFGSTRQAS